MPGFATSDLTLNNAHGLMKALGISAREIDIKPSCLQMLRDLEHPFIGGEPVYDITFENVQAGERTSHLFRLANHHDGIVLGTCGLEPFDTAEREGVLAALGRMPAMLTPKSIVGETFGGSGGFALASSIAWLTGAPVHAAMRAPRYVIALAVGYHGNATATVLGQA